MTAPWCVDRYAVKCGDVYEVFDDALCAIALRKCRVVRVLHDNTDDDAIPGVTQKPYVEVTVRHEDGTPDRVLHGPEIQYFLRKPPFEEIRTLAPVRSMIAGVSCRHTECRIRGQCTIYDGPCVSTRPLHEDDCRCETCKVHA